MRVKEIIDELYNQLPQEYRIPVKLCKNFVDVCRELQNLGHYTYCQSPEDVKILYNTTPMVKTNWRSPLQRKYPPTRYPRKSFGLFAVASNPILVNRREMDRQPKHIIMATILHEIGHHVCGRGSNAIETEEIADIFALRMMDRIKV